MDDEKEDIRDVQMRFKKEAPITLVCLIISVSLYTSLPPIKQLAPNLWEWPVWWFWPTMIILVVTMVLIVRTLLDASDIYIEWQERRNNAHSL